MYACLKINRYKTDCLPVTFAAVIFFDDRRKIFFMLLKNFIPYERAMLLLNAKQ